MTSNCRCYNDAWVHNPRIFHYGPKGSSQCLINDIRYNPSPGDSRGLYDQIAPTKLIWYANRIAHINADGVEISTFDRYGNITRMAEYVNTSVKFKIFENKSFEVQYTDRKISPDNLEYIPDMIFEDIFWQNGYIVDVALYRAKKVLEYGTPNFANWMTELFASGKIGHVRYPNTENSTANLCNTLIEYWKEIGYNDALQKKTMMLLKNENDCYDIYGWELDVSYKQELIKKGILSGERFCDNGKITL